MGCRDWGYGAFAGIVALAIGSSARAQLCEPQWSALPGGDLNGPVEAMTVWDDDGPGPNEPALFVGGRFTMAGGLVVNGIAKWDGEQWWPLGEGVSHATRIPTVLALIVHDEDGDGPDEPALFAGGLFDHAGGTSVHAIARWDGEVWSGVGEGFRHPICYPVSNFALSFAVWDEDGNGPQHAKLFAGISPRTIECWSTGRPDIWRWYNGAWTEVWGASMPQDRLGPTSPPAMAVFDDGSGPALFAVNREVQGRVSTLPKWNGIAWSAAFPGVVPVNALAHFDAGGGAALAFCGALRLYTSIDGQLTLLGTGVFRFSTWPVPAEELLIGGGVYLRPVTIRSFDWDVRSPSLASLFVGGDLRSAWDLPQPSMSRPISNIARWTGSSWDEMDGGIATPTISCSAAPQSETRIPPGSFPVMAMTVFDADDGPQLYVGGCFDTAGGQPAINIARWGVKSIPGDSDGSGVVDFADVLSALAGSGAEYAPITEGGPGTGPGDANLDGSVNFQDVFSVMANWGRRCDE